MSSAFTSLATKAAMRVPCMSVGHDSVVFISASATALLAVLMERACVSTVISLSISFALISCSTCCWSLTVAGRIVAISHAAAIFRCLRALFDDSALHAITWRWWLTSAMLNFSPTLSINCFSFSMMWFRRKLLVVSLSISLAKWTIQ